MMSRAMLLLSLVQIPHIISVYERINLRPYPSNVKQNKTFFVASVIAMANMR
jgi:hypothetical protein